MADLDEPGFARALAKFHVKSFLRKLNVSNRAEATAHYLWTSLHAGS